MYKIAKGVPLPPRPQLTYPFADMAPGDSFAIPCSIEERHRIQQRLSGRVCAAAKKLGYTFTTAQENHGVRCWRVK